MNFRGQNRSRTATRYRPRGGRRPAPSAPPARPAFPEPAADLSGPDGGVGTTPMTHELQSVQGVLEMHPKGYGFLRSPARSYLAQVADPYVPAPLIQRAGLRQGVLVAGPVEGPRKGMGPRLMAVDSVEGENPRDRRQRNFDDLTPIDPHDRLVLETTPDRLTTRVMDLLTPIGRGQRGLIVAPPRTGKTILLQHIAQAVTQNYPEMRLVMLLIDERPEEVTEMRRTVRGEVVASSSDRDSSEHGRLAELVVDRAKRLAEAGQHVFVLLDSLTRLARAYNKHAGNSGRTMSGGLDSRAMEVPRRLFGSARVFEEGGSLTVMATALIDTGSRMDDFIFQEFKGTGNMELVLDRRLADRRVFPAMDIAQSGTRREERLLPPEVLQRVTLLRRSLVALRPVEAMEALVKQLGKSASNGAFLDRISTYVR